MKLSESIGGVGSLRNPYLRAQIISLDDILSCIDLQPCMVRYDYGPCPLSGVERQKNEEEVLSFEEDGTLATSLLSNNAPMLPASLRDLILQILECHNTKLLLETGFMSATRASQARHWLTMRTFAIRNRLLALTDIEDSKIDALRVVLIMWTLLPANNLKRAKIVQIITPKLKSTLQRGSPHAWQDHEDVHFWILLIGCFCAEDETEAHAWFADDIRDMLLFELSTIGLQPTGAGLVEDLVAFQRRFFFHEALLRPVTEKLAEWLVWWDIVPAIC